MKSINYFLIFLIYFLSVNISNTQVNEEWVKRYNANGDNDMAEEIAVDNLGNVYVTGYSSISGYGPDYFTIKYNSAGVQQWTKRFNPASLPYNNDMAKAIAIDNSGNVYVTGISEGTTLGYDIVTIKYSSSGVQQWVQRYDGPNNNNDEPRSIAADGLGNVYVTGYSSGSGTLNDYVTIKYNSPGALLWVQRYNGPGNGNDDAYSLKIDDPGNVYITGGSTGNGTDYDIATIKYNNSGTMLWVQRFNGQGNLHDDGKSITIDASGNVYVTGNSYNTTTWSDYTTIKYNSSGVQQWVKIYAGTGGSNNDESNSIGIDSSGNVYVTGFTTLNYLNFDFATIKYSSAGVQQWVQTYSGLGNSNDIAYSLAVESSGNVYITGKISNSGSYSDYGTLKYNSSGVLQWVQKYNGPGNNNDVSVSVVIDNSNSVYVTGSSMGSGTGYDYATIKYNQNSLPPNLLLPANGSIVTQPLTLVWSKCPFAQTYHVQVANDSLFTNVIINDSTLADTTKIVTNLPGNIWYYWRVKTKYSGGTSPWSSVWKFNPLFVGIKEIGSEVPKNYSLSQNYPNPFNPTAKIQFSISLWRGVDSEGGRGVLVRLIIYDVLCREVTTLVNDQLQPGIYEVDWNASNYSSGVYFYKLITTDFIEPRKMILIK